MPIGKKSINRVMNVANPEAENNPIVATAIFPKTPEIIAEESVKPAEAPETVAVETPAAPVEEAHEETAPVAETESAQAEVALTVETVAVETAPAAAVEAPKAKRKYTRHASVAKKEKVTEEKPKKKPGRPKKNVAPVEVTEPAIVTEPVATVEIAAKKKPGRPKKNAAPVEVTEPAIVTEPVATVEVAAKKKPGRPKKNVVSATKKKPGRPKRNPAPVTDNATVAKKRPGRPKKAVAVAEPAVEAPVVEVASVVASVEAPAYVISGTQIISIGDEMPYYLL